MSFFYSEPEMINEFESQCRNKIDDAKKYHRADWSGTDKDTAYGDYYLGTKYNHVLIEFKNSNIITSEKNKALRKELCKNLQRKKLVRISSKCHFYAWSNLEKKIIFDKYICKICSPSIFKTCAKESEKEVVSQIFIDKLFKNSGENGVNHKDFLKYLKFMLNMYEKESDKQEKYNVFPLRLISVDSNNRVIESNIDNLDDLNNLYLFFKTLSSDLWLKSFSIGLMIYLKNLIHNILNIIMEIIEGIFKNLRQ